MAGHPSCHDKFPRIQGCPDIAGFTDQKIIVILFQGTTCHMMMSVLLCTSSLEVNNWKIDSFEVNNWKIDKLLPLPQKILFTIFLEVDLQFVTD